MIERLYKENVLDVIEFLARVPDTCEDFYVTINKDRIFLKNNFSLITKILKNQEVYGLFEKELKGLAIVYREKGFRPYLKLLAVNKKYAIDIMKFIGWNFGPVELYAKIKSDSPLLDVFIKKIFMKIGFRGKEVLLVKKGIKGYKQLVPKDDYLGE